MEEINQNEQENPEQIESPNAENTDVFLSPEGIIMMGFAIGLDTFGELLPIISDVIGTLFIGGWTLFRSQNFQITSSASARMGKFAKWANRMKWIRPVCVIAEFTPLTVAPCWTILVYTTLKYS